MKRDFQFLLIAVVLTMVGAGCQTAGKNAALIKPSPQEEPIHEDWIQRDRESIAKVNGELKTDPANIDKILINKSTEGYPLGFGYRIVAGATKGGYASYFYSFLYHGQELESYQLVPPLPRYDRRLRPAYLEMIRDVFTVTTNGTAEVYFYKRQAVDSPMEDCPVHPAISREMAIFMSPFSGSMYRIRGGFIGSIMSNRRRYYQIKDQITPDICLMLLYSKNPATRLFAYEHYLRHPKDYVAVLDAIEQRMRVVFKETPKITTMNGCMIMEENSAKLVEEFVHDRESESEMTREKLPAIMPSYYRPPARRF